MTHWYDIASAPKDGTVIWGYVPGGVEVSDRCYSWPKGSVLYQVPIRWTEEGERQFMTGPPRWFAPMFDVESGYPDDPGNDYIMEEVEPSHWMPLPDPPEI